MTRGPLLGPHGFASQKDDSQPIFVLLECSHSSNPRGISLLIRVPRIIISVRQFDHHVDCQYFVGSPRPVLIQLSSELD